MVSHVRRAPVDDAGLTFTVVVAVARRPYTRTVDVRPVERAGPCRTLLPLSVMPHNYVYLVDSTLIIGYARDEFPGWRAWAEEHVRNGGSRHLAPGKGLLRV